MGEAPRKPLLIELQTIVTDAVSIVNHHPLTFVSSYISPSFFSVTSMLLALLLVYFAQV